MLLLLLQEAIAASVCVPFKIYPYKPYKPGDCHAKSISF